MDSGDTPGALRDLIVASLQEQGFLLRGDRILLPPALTKARLRSLHAQAVQHRLASVKPRLCRYEPNLLRRIASGQDVVPEQITPRLVEVQPGSEDELLFRYASLHWSIPVSSGYGRRLRFLVIDEQNEKLIGLFGLGDPVFSLAARDTWIGWSYETRRERLHYVMDAFVLGAVPPYSLLLCGKLVAMLATSSEVSEAFRRKYGQRRSLILGRHLDSSIGLITTTSALGRSSIYNRLKHHDRLLYHSAGFTRGYGEFHFSNGLYSRISEYVVRHCEPTAKQDRWGSGFRNRREVIRKCLMKLGLSSEWLHHGVQREVFVVPLAKNTRAVLQGAHTTFQWYDQPAEDLFSWFRQRWLLSRAQRDRRYMEFVPSSYRLWPENE